MVLTVLAAVAQLEREQLQERVRAGLANAVAQGRTLGRPPALTEDQEAEARALRDGGWTVRHLQDHFGVSRTTIYRAL